MSRRVSWQCSCGAITFAAVLGEEGWLVAPHLKHGTTRSCKKSRTKVKAMIVGSGTDKETEPVTVDVFRDDGPILRRGGWDGAVRVADLPHDRGHLPAIVQPIGNCDGSGHYAYDASEEDGRGKRLKTKCPGCRACK